MVRTLWRRWRLALLASVAGLLVVALHLAAVRHEQLEFTDVLQVVAAGVAILVVLLLPFWLACAAKVSDWIWWFLLFAGLALQVGAAAIFFLSREQAWRECGGFCELGSASIDVGGVVAVGVLVASMLLGSGLLVAAWVGMIVALVLHRRESARPRC